MKNNEDEIRRMKLYRDTLIKAGGLLGFLVTVRYIVSKFI